MRPSAMYPITPVPILFLLIVVVIVMGNSHEIPGVPKYIEQEFNGGNLEFCTLGVVNQSYYKSEGYYLRVLNFDGNPIAIIRHNDDQSIRDVWVWTKQGGNPDEYFEGDKKLKTKYPNGPCSILEFYNAK